MNNTQKQIYADLQRIRERLKLQTKLEDGRAASICTDDALEWMACHSPHEVNDFNAAPGIGDVFINEYASYFLAVINKYSDREEQITPLSAEITGTLRELEKKLVNINRRNRLLYLPKLSPRYAFDLFDASGSYDALDIIFNGESAEICNTSQGKDGTDRYKRIVTLLREVNKDLRENGQYDLYIAYPFVKGKLPGEDFNVRAPLALFPVQVAREAEHITVKLDKSRDVIYNNTIILAYCKLNGITRPLPDNEIEEYSFSSLPADLISFYDNEGLTLKAPQAPLGCFTEYAAADFPKYAQGEMYIEEAIVLGKFPTFADALQKDFNALITGGEITPLLSELLTGIDDIDIYNDAEPLKKCEQAPVSERALTYISSMNGSQEDVIFEAKNRDALVVHGPPGTGKSQTITNLIADSIKCGKTVLLVSEKKAALDVVYSRLGKLNKYALIIDDTNDKNSFYTQISDLLSIKDKAKECMEAIDAKSDLVDSCISGLDSIAKKLYSVGSFGIEPYKLYLTNRRYNLRTPETQEAFIALRDAVDAELFNTDYPTLVEAHDKLSHKEIFDRFCTYRTAISKAPWLEKVNPKLDEYSLLSCKEAANKLATLISEWQGKSFIARALQKSKLTDAIKAFGKSYFNACDDTLITYFLDNGFDCSGFDDYSAFSDSVPHYSSLSELERKYAQGIGSLMEILNTDFNSANDELINLIVCDYLYRFEADNKPEFLGVSDFRNTVLDISKAIEEKQSLTQVELNALLYKKLGNLLNSKRRGELDRAAQSKRRRSVRQFVDKFSFELLSGIAIWMMTPSVVSELLPLRAGLFDLVIFDEASQMYIERGLPSIFRAKRVVIAGDSKQLRPSSLGAGRITADDEDTETFDVNAALEEESLLDVARFKYYPPVMLNYHYRAKYEELIAFSNYAFYEGGLCVSPNTQSPEQPPIEVYKVEDGRWVNRSNSAEAKKTVEIVKEFLLTRKNGETLGVITFNSSQRDLIDDYLDEECAVNPEFAAVLQAELCRRENGEDIGFFVKNIENVQGDERDVILFSIGYANNENGKLVHNYGWLNQKGGENRLNVAISRAKRKIFIVTSFEPSELKVENSANPGPKLLKSYLEYCFAVSSRNNELARVILLGQGGEKEVEQVASCALSDYLNNALSEAGYNVERNVGIGGYSIDLAVRGGDKYILGIECDEKLYTDDSSARERDYHRQKYLESRGWSIIRVWSSDFWKDKNAMLQKLCEYIDAQTGKIR